MKRCTQCNRVYDDDSLRFCLDDGTSLVAVDQRPVDPPATVMYSPAESAAAGPLTRTLRDAPLTRSNYAVTTDEGRGSRQSEGSSNRGLTFAVIAIGLVLIVIATIGVVLLWRQTAKDAGTTQAVKNEAPTPATATSPVRATSLPNSEQGNLESTRGLRINVDASSVRYSVQSNTYVASNAIDGSRRTAWIEGADGPGLGESLRFDFGREINLHRIVILPGYFKSAEIWKQNNRLSRVTLYFSNGTSQSVGFPDQMERQSIDLGSIKTRSVRLEINEVYSGSDPDTAISEVVFEWEP